MSSSALGAWLIFPLIILALFSFPIVLGFLAGLWEKRMVWPYAADDDARPLPADSSNPYAPPTPGRSLEASEYVLAVCHEAQRRGYQSQGRFRNIQGKLYKLGYEFWLAPDRMVLVMVGSGTLAGIPLKATRMFTRKRDGHCLVTIDDPKAGDSDPTGTTEQVVVANADFAELLRTHRSRIEQAASEAIPYSQTDPLLDHRAFRAGRAEALVNSGWARYLDPEYNWYKYTVKGSFLASVRMALKEWRRAIRDRDRQKIRRPGQQGYLPSTRRAAVSPRWLERIRIVFWGMAMVGFFSILVNGPVRTRAQLLFRIIVPLVGFTGLFFTWLLKLALRQREPAPADASELARPLR
jgi:hypothetical protein